MYNRYDRAAALEMQIEHLKKEKKKIDKKLSLLQSAMSKTANAPDKIYEAVWSSLEQQAKEPRLFSRSELDYSKKILSRMPEDLKQDISAAMQDHMLELAELTHQEPSSVKVQKAIKDFHNFLNRTHGGIYTLDRFAKLGDYYVDSVTFRNHLEEMKEGFSVFIKEAISIYVSRSLNKTLNLLNKRTKRKGGDQ